MLRVDVAETGLDSRLTVEEVLSAVRISQLLVEEVVEMESDRSVRGCISP